MSFGLASDYFGAAFANDHKVGIIERSTDSDHSDFFGFFLSKTD